MPPSDECAPPKHSRGEYGSAPKPSVPPGPATSMGTSGGGPEGTKPTSHWWEPLPWLLQNGVALEEAQRGLGTGPSKGTRTPKAPGSIPSYFLFPLLKCAPQRQSLSTSPGLQP